MKAITRLSIGTALANGLLMFGASVAAAQGNSAAPAAAPAAQSGVRDGNEIIVTARRRDESLQDVPVAVSVFSDDKRDLLAIETADDIAKFTPGMEFNLATVTIRGVGRTGLTLGADPGIANYYDGVYSDNAGSIAGAPISIERIEVLRGPQGTLFGRNSIGGAINVVSKRPSKEFEGEFRQTIGNYDLFKTQLMLTGPITDRLRFRVEGLRTKRDGYVKNLTGSDRGNEDSLSGNVALEWDVTDDIQVWVQYSNGHWSRDKKNVLGTFVDPYDTTTRFIGYGPSPLFGYTGLNPTTTKNPFIVDENFDGYFSLTKSPKWTGHFDWDLGGVKFRYIGGHYRAEAPFYYDLDGSARDGYIGSAGSFISSDLRIRSASVLSSWSNEVQLLSDGTGPFSWIVGAYQGHDSNGGTVQILNPGQAQLETAFDLANGTFAPVANPDRRHLFSRSKVVGNTYALFAQGDWEFTEGLTATAGYRHTWDKKRATIDTQLFYYDPDGQGPLAGTQALLASLGLLPPAATDYAVLLVDSASVQRDKWDGDTIRFGLNWQPSPRTTIYGSFATGYKAGGFNTSFPLAVGKEKVNAFELGYKGNLADGVQLNAALFYNVYKDIQVAARVPASSVGGPPALGVQEFVVNADKAEIYGLEAEMVLSPTDHLQINANYSYLRTKFLDFDLGVFDPNNPAGGFQDLTGNKLPRSPRHKVVIAPIYTIDVPGGTLSLSGSYVWTAKQYASIFNTPTYEIPAHDETDVRLTYRDEERGFRIIGFMNNVFNEHYPLDVGTQPNFPSVRYWRVLAEPRTYGVELQLTF